MIVRMLTSLPLVGIAVLWLYIALKFMFEFFSGAQNVISFLFFCGVIPVSAAGLTIWAIWGLRAPAGEKAAARILLAVVDGFCLFIWVGSMLGWGGGV